MYDELYKIEFTSRIKDLQRLLDLINVAIARNKIKCSFVDLGLDTRRRILAIKTPSDERTMLLRQGIVHEVSKLTTSSNYGVGADGPRS